MEQEIMQKMKTKAALLFGRQAEDISDEADFVTDLGAKSVDMVKIITMLEDEYGVDINFMEFRRKKTLTLAAAYVASLC